MVETDHPRPVWAEPCILHNLAILQIYKVYIFFFFYFSWPAATVFALTAAPQLEEKQQSLSSIETKLRESEKSLGETSKEKDVTIRSLQEQVCACVCTSSIQFLSVSQSLAFGVQMYYKSHIVWMQEYNNKERVSYSLYMYIYSC